MRERLQKLRDCFVQLSGSRRFIASAHARSDAGAATPVGHNQALLLQFGVRARHRIGSDAEVTCQLTHGGQRVACAQLAAFYKAAELIHDLLKRCEIGIDRKEQFPQDVGSPRRPR